MSFYEVLTVIISSFALVGLIISLWFLRGQVKVMNEQTQQIQRSLATSAEATLNTLFAQITQAYLDYPKLRPVFYENESTAPSEPLNDELRYRACALAEQTLDAMERTTDYYQQGVSESAGAYYNWMHDSFRQSRFLREWLARNSNWYSSTVNGILQSVKAELRRKPVPAVRDKDAVELRESDQDRSRRQCE